MVRSYGDRIFRLKTLPEDYAENYKIYTFRIYVTKVE